MAGGLGTRMNAGLPKQFLVLGDYPVLMHTIHAFYQADPSIQILLALPASSLNTWQELVNMYRFRIPHQVIEGGQTRFHSVKNALGTIDVNGLIAIHDGVRPLITTDLILRSFHQAAKKGNAIPAIPVQESIRKIRSTKSYPQNRDQFRIIQTPQVFRITDIKLAYQLPYRKNFTDDSTVAESAGFPIHLFEGDPENIKITRPTDLIIAEALLSKRSGNP